MKTIKLSLFLLCLFSNLLSQNETSKWYFGKYAALDFMTVPPTTLNNSAMIQGAGCSSIADETGNLLFYTDGVTIWNKQHVVMANATGLQSYNIYCQSPLIVKQPGSQSIYYVFSVGSALMYSVVDMSLAAGMGSVTTKSVSINSPSTNKLCGAKHCNGSDIWIISHDAGNNNFRANLLNSAGLNTVAVISGVGTTYTNSNFAIGNIKISPNGKKLGVAIHKINMGSFEIYDFNSLSGVVSTSLSLGSNFSSVYGCEFSPDGSKFYGSSLGGPLLYQWNLCAGSNSAIIASQDTISNTAFTFAGLQLASNGKIYVSEPGNQFLGVINDPNNPGNICNYFSNGQSVGTGTCGYGLPNFISSTLKTPFTFTNSYTCNTVSFTSSYFPGPATCSAASDPINAIEWFFGDSPSGASNTSTLSNPVHQYPIAGTYKVKLVIHAGTCVADTIINYVKITAPPTLSLSGNFTLCPGATATITASGASSYSWSNNGTSASVVLSPSATTVYSVTGSYVNTTCTSTKTLSVVRATCVGLPANELNEFEIKLFPNPFQNKLSVSTIEKLNISIYNTTGKLLDVFTFNEGTTALDLSNYSCGIYFLQIETRNAYFYSKIIKLE